MLTLTMIIGVITVVAVIVTRMPRSFDTQATTTLQTGLPNVPAGINLPKGATPQAITFGTGWTAVVTTDNRILIFSNDGQLQQDVSLLGN